MSSLAVQRNPYDDQAYMMIPYSRIMVCELLLLREFVLDGDWQAVVIPVRKNEAVVDAIIRRSLPKMEDMLNKLEMI